MARRGNGVGCAESRGPGWGGPARGAGTASLKAPKFGPGNRNAAGPHDMTGHRRRQELLDKLETLAFTAENEDTQLYAAVAWLNRVEGKPLARIANLEQGDVSALDDAALAAIALPAEEPEIQR